jgi:hypothetical protein
MRSDGGPEPSSDVSEANDPVGYTNDQGKLEVLSLRHAFTEAGPVFPDTEGLFPVFKSWHDIANPDPVEVHGVWYAECSLQLTAPRN